MNPGNGLEQGRADGVMFDITLGMTGGENGDGDGGRAHHADGELMRWRVTEDLGGHEVATATTP